jgi:hypothetical protein
MLTRIKTGSTGDTLVAVNSDGILSLLVFGSNHRTHTATGIDALVAAHALVVSAH